ncbi:MAG: dihydropyrimidinase [Clostridia bacterium]|jgi:N-methylhydantoinase A/oxoprolinase/acetone carboxylase beta subunit|nr:dihydropyrimidinase [Clostridia bacterium]
MKIGIGIDTGGTYTDAVIYNFEKQCILGSAKALTTKDNLSIGIGNALDNLPKEMIGKAEVVSLSTTLATNACVENKGGRAKLLFFGADKEVVEKVGDKYGLPPISDICFEDSASSFSGQIIKEPDWDAFTNHLDERFKGYDAVGIVEMNAFHTGAGFEIKAKELLSKNLDIPAVCGHELFSDLNVVQRGSSTLLNARLIPIIKAFLRAVKEALSCRGISAPIVIVRSDGSLMSEQFASVRPVETLLCGPAASVIGAIALTNENNSIIVDMGGTTTDIALVKEGIPVKVKEGINIGKWKTFVKGLCIDTFGLGGDSAVRYKGGRMFLDTNRVVPLAIIASEYPQVVIRLKELIASNHTHDHYLHEFLVLTKDISSSPYYTEDEKVLCEALKDGPLIYADAAEKSGHSIYSLKTARLEKEGIIMRCGLTPTDIMHIRGDFTAYNREATELGALYVARCLDITLEDLCEKVYQEVKRKLYFNIVRILLEDRNPMYKTDGIGVGLEALIYDTFEQINAKEADPFMSALFQTSGTLIGVGGPIHIFLSDVAKMLGTKAVIPEYAGVANALGAVTSHISASYTIEIRPNLNGEEEHAYLALGGRRIMHFADLDAALIYAKAEAEACVREEAIKRGAVGGISISTEIIEHTAPIAYGEVHLSTKVIAAATAEISF